MTTPQNKRAVTVGIFIFLGLAFFIVGIMAIGNIRKSFTKSVSVLAVFDDVEGLKVGNNIWFSGMKIGTVKRMDFFGKSQVQVTMFIDEKAQPHIRKDTKAKISSDGLIGNKIVVLYDGTDAAPMVESNDRLLVETTVSNEDMINTFQASNKNLLSITGDIKVITAQIRAGQGTIGKLMSDSSLYVSLDATLASLRSASANAQRLTVSLTQFANGLNKPGTLSYGLTTDTALYSNLKATMRQLDEVTATANEVTINLKNASSDLNNTNSPMGVLLHDRDGAKSLQETMKNLESSSKKLDEDLEAAQHSFLLRGFFKKKEK